MVMVMVILIMMFIIILIMMFIIILIMMFINILMVGMDLVDVCWKEAGRCGRGHPPAGETSSG